MTDALSTTPTPSSPARSLRRSPSGDPAKPGQPARNPVVEEWIERAERLWRMATLLPDLPPGYLIDPVHVQRCLESDLRAAQIAQGVRCRKCRDLGKLSDKLRVPNPGWQANPETLNLPTQAALAYLDPGEGIPNPARMASGPSPRRGRSAMACTVGVPACRPCPRDRSLRRWCCGCSARQLSRVY
jgi:hypothetical protein